MAKYTIGVVFDFADTLVPDSTTAFLQSKGIDTDDFWKRARALLDEGWDQPHAYLRLMLDLVVAGGPLEGLSSEELKAFGASLELYPGVATLFRDLKNQVAEEFENLDVSVKFWVISGGLQEIVAGCTKISRHLEGFWGCRLAPDSAGVLRNIARVVTFTEKTRYLFEINKGLRQEQTDRNPLLVNKDVKDRPVPLENMIYVGDGLTDIPCFSLIKKNGGAVFGVLQRDVKGKPKIQAFQDLVIEGRVNSSNSPQYGNKSDLGGMIRAAVTRRCMDLVLQEREVLR